MKIKRGKVILEPGDKVRITAKPRNPNVLLYWNPLMDEWKGKIVTLSYRASERQWKVKENDWTWDERWFDGIIKEIKELKLNWKR